VITSLIVNYVKCLGKVIFLTRKEKYTELIKMGLIYPKKVPINHLLTEMSPMEFCAIGSFLSFEEENDGKHITVNRLAKDMQISMPLASRMLKNLESKELIRRVTDESCRRNTFVLISDKGKEIFKKNSKVVMQYIDKVLSVFSDSEIETIISMQNKMIASMDNAIKDFE